MAAVIGLGLLVCAFGGVILRLACTAYNRLNAIEAKSSHTEIDDAETIKFTTVEAGPYTTPSNYSSKTFNPLESARVDQVVMPTILSASTVSCLVLLVWGFTTVVTTGLSAGLFPGNDSAIKAIVVIVFLGAPVFIHSAFISLWLKVRWRKAIALTLFCALQVIVVGIIAFVVLGAISIAP